ncbi:MAG: carboxypeptidase regulatory-like domain-containing protein [Candidatus Sulfotelmatobacter sp.]
METSRSEISTQSKDPVPAGASNDVGEEFSPRPALPFARKVFRKALLASAAALALTLLLTSLAAAQTLTGTVKNVTTGKPAAGDDVVLLSLTQGMEESARTKTDAKGNFTLKLDDAQSPHLVRAIHQGVTYHRMAPPGTTSVEVEVYDAGKKIDGISVVADIMRIQSAQGQIEIVREFGVQNSSKPPRTQMDERNLEFYIPDGAQIIADSATATTENGNPLKTAPVPEGEKNRYSFLFPLRPGLTRFEVAYQMPYTGSANLDPKSQYPLEHFVVMTPKAMQFTAAATSAGYKLINYPNEPDASVQVASNFTPGQNLAFKVSGEGTLADSQEGGGEQGETASAPPSGNRPGGGLGPPIDAPDPLQKYRWPILGGFGALLVFGAVFVAARQQSAGRAGRGKLATIEDSESDYELPEAAVSRSQSSRSARRNAPSMLLEALKEELFQLEVEHTQGHISQQEYEKTKAALDQTLQHALKREAQKA